MTALFTLHGLPQFYAWGGMDFLRSMMNLPATPQKPFAEWWMGAHPEAPSVVDTPMGPQPLTFALAQHGGAWLGDDVVARYGRHLPFLFKVLDVSGMLSIQAHPNLAQAAAGFARENAAGLDLHDPRRNYKDDQHKPEVGVALGDFWLLHGFRTEAGIKAAFSRFPSLQHLGQVLDEKGIKGLFAHVMTLPMAESDALLAPVVAHARGQKWAKDDPLFWVARAVGDKTENFDRGLFSILMLNLVHLAPGQGIYQDAGILHAYLEGYTIELMANSDNVLRAGLTPKHVDVPELLSVGGFSPVTPRVLDPVAVQAGVWTYDFTQPDFALDVVRADRTVTPRFTTTGPEILLVTEGQAQVQAGEDSVTLARGMSVFVTAGADVVVTATDSAVLYRARVGKKV